MVAAAVLIGGGFATIFVRSWIAPHPDPTAEVTPVDVRVQPRTEPASTSAQPVPMADPAHITIARAGIDSDIALYTVEDAASSYDTLTGVPCYDPGRDKIICVNPPSGSVPVWLRAGVGKIPYGSRPGTDAVGNVYIVGHASSTAEAVFTRLYEAVVGDQISLTTANGTLHYTIQDVQRVAKSEYNKLPVVNEQVGGRLIVSTCDHSPDAALRNGVAEENLVVVAQLTSSEPMS